MLAALTPAVTDGFASSWLVRKGIHALACVPPDQAQPKRTATRPGKVEARTWETFSTSSAESYADQPKGRAILTKKIRRRQRFRYAP